jgi:formylglycine-generating enzyme required for sulfatase activity
MKHLLNATLLLLALLLPATATAHDFAVNGIYYRIMDDNEVVVTFRGTSYNSFTNEYTGDVTIPSTVTYSGTTYAVTSIGNYAFYGCYGLTSVSIPNSVTFIGNSTCYGCTGLTCINIPNSVTDIGNSAFYGCEGLNDVYSQIADPSFISMGSDVFKLESSDYSNRILHVPFGAKPVYSADSNWRPYFSTIVVHDIFEVDHIQYTITSDTTVKVLGPACSFPTNEFIGDVNIPNSVIRYGDIFFVTDIENNAFLNCTGLTSVTIPESVSSIGNNAFNGCTALSEINFNAINCSGFPSVLSNHPFYNSNISIINLGNSVQRIPDYLACGLSKLENISIPNSVTSIGRGAFNGCSGLTSVTIPESVSSIGDNAFNGCTALSEINFDAINCSGFPSVLSNHPFYNSNISIINLGNSVQIIPDYFAFKLTQLNSIDIPNSVTAIGNYAFYGCSSLTNATIPMSASSIGNSAFSGCSGLTDVFSHIVDPSSISMGSDVFLIDYYIINDQPEVIYSNRLLHVPKGSIEAYKTDINWRPYFGSIVDDDSVSLNDLNFVIDNMKYTIISDSTVKVSGPLYWDVDGYGPYGGEGDVDLVGNFFDFNIPDHITYNNKVYTVSEIGDWAFIFLGIENYDEDGYIAINYNIKIPETVTSIGLNAFGGSVGIVNLICQAMSPPIMNHIIDDNFYGIVNLFVPADAYLLYQENNDQNHYFDSIYITDGEQSSSPIYTDEYLYQPFTFNYSGPYGIAVKIFPKEKSTIYIRQTYNNTGLYNHIYSGEWKKYEERDSLYFFYEAEGDPFGAFPDCWAIEFFVIEEGKSPSPDMACGLLDKCSMSYKDWETFDFIDSHISYNIIDNSAEVTFSGYVYTGPGEKSNDIADSFISNPNLKASSSIKYNYDEDYEGVNAFDYYSGDLVIPSSAVHHKRCYYGSNDFECYDTYTTYPVTAINWRAFMDCVDLISVTMPNTITSIDEQVFLNCPKLTFIKCLGATPPDACFESFDEGVYQNTTLYVPLSAVEVYRNAEGWKNFQNIIGFYHYDFEVDGVCYLVTGDQEVVVVHGEEAYQGNLVVPGTVTSEGTTYTVTGIGSGAFADANLGCLTLPVSISNNIASDAFEGSQIQSVYITGEGAWTAGALPDGVGNLYVGSGVTAVPGLQVNPTTIYSYSSVPPTCDENTFTGYDAELHVPASSLAAYFTAPYWSNFINIVGDAVEPTELTLDNDSISILVGNQQLLTATIEPENATPSQVSWESSNEGVATVVDGMVQAVGVGECDIKAWLLDKSAVCHVTVTEIAPTEVTLNQTFAKLEIGSQLALTATVLPDDATDKVITWASSNAEVATVDSLGNVLAVGPGECDITASCRDKQATCHVIVVEHFIFITLDQHELSVLPNHIAMLTPNVSPVSTDLRVTSSNPAVAAARMANGQIQVVGITEGTTIITVNSADGYAEPDSCVVTVYTERGDVNCDGFVNISDATRLITYLSTGNNTSMNEENADCNNDGLVNISDAIRLISYLSGNGTLVPKDPTPVETETITVNGVAFEMVKVGGGSFMMGCTPEQDSEASNNEAPVHRVTLSTYYIGQTEVTQELWQAVMGSNPSNFTDNPQCPVERVTWDDCQTFVAQLSQLTGKTFRLPTEAEWEFAARGGNKSQGYTYAGSNDLDEIAWFNDNSESATHPVGLKKANELGLYDMTGNVYEWCSDRYGLYPETPETDPVGPETGSSKIYRGGGWQALAKNCRNTRRNYFAPGVVRNYMGLRLVMTE